MRPEVWIGRAQVALAIGAAAVIVCSTVADVVLRYGFGRPIHGAYDIVECMLVLLVFHGMAAVFQGGGHITIDVVDHLIGPGMRRGLMTVAQGLSVVALLLLGWAMITPAMQAFDYGDRKLELGLKVWVVWAFALSGVAGCVVAAVLRVVRER